jgi:hypothetical protein
MRYRSGDWVEIKSAQEILATLDDKCEIDGMPFMPEMLRFCGARFRVAAVAHKTCDVANKTGGRRMHDAVHLEGLRCDGSGHGGCEAGCLLFWKTAWLQPARDGVTATGDSRNAFPDGSKLQACASREDPQGLVYSCQATRLYDATEPLAWWDIRQYVRDLWYRNVRLGRFLRVALLRGLYNLRNLGIGYGFAVALHDRVHRLVTGRPTPYPTGVIPQGQPTPTENLGLRQGEWVTVRPLAEIRGTITEHNFNRGMRFDKEMAQFCDQRFRVAKRVERLIDERTGRMLTMKSPCIVLDGVVCSSDYSERRLFCPRQIYPYFREIWLRRVR